ncbi:DAZ-associated protein 1 [Dissostichus eleginoides]|uniref:DAZ-associated protein 1 n=1 Tax=Dissostichus eleginoides TaxID=100907 RepID=A0AAD9CA37_DISEL|nr:DAZ-associated protein 1 [Dissostichus eleginoides]
MNNNLVGDEVGQGAVLPLRCVRSNCTVLGASALKAAASSGASLSAECCVCYGSVPGKLFVGGLDWSTTQETLRNYFSQYGEVVDCVIMKDKATNQSRGFGFVKFKDPNCVRTVLETKPHNLDGRNIDPKPCTPRGMQPEKSRTKEGWKGSKADSNKSKKIFVGGIPHNCGEPELRDYFNRFGVVTEVVMIYDAEKQRPRAKLLARSALASGCPGASEHSQWVDSTACPRLAAALRGAGLTFFSLPEGVWVSTTGQPLGGYAPQLTASRGHPTHPPSPFNGFLVTTPAGGFAAPQAFPQQGYSTAPQFAHPQRTITLNRFLLRPQLQELHLWALLPPPTQDSSKAPTGQPDFPYCQYGLGNYLQDPSAYGPTRPSHSNGQDEQGGYSAGYGQDLTAFSHTFADPSQPTASYGTAQPAGPQATATAFGRGQNHNVQGFHPYRR